MVACKETKCKSFIFVANKYCVMNIDSNILNSAGWLGTPEIVIIVLVIILLFGGRKIPELMKGLGKGIKEFKEGVADDKDKDKDKDASKKDENKKSE